MAELLQLDFGELLFVVAVVLLEHQLVLLHEDVYSDSVDEVAVELQQVVERLEVRLVVQLLELVAGVRQELVKPLAAVEPADSVEELVGGPAEPAVEEYSVGTVAATVGAAEEEAVAVVVDEPVEAVADVAAGEVVVARSVVEVVLLSVVAVQGV